MAWLHFLLFVHLLGVIVWVGGMAFAYLCLRPAAMSLEPPARLTLWSDVFSQFFPLVWISVVAIVGSGIAMLLRVGFANAPQAWHVMFAVGLVMTGIFVYVWSVPWRRLRNAVEQQQWPQGALALGRIRQGVAVNLLLGTVNVAVATIGLAV